MKRITFILSLLVLLVLSGCKPKEITIGAVLPESGEAALYGQAVKEGVEIAETYVQNSTDFTNNYKVLYMDTQSDADRAVKLMDEEVKDGAIAIIGGVTSTEALKMVDLCSKYQRVLLSPSASLIKLSDVTPYFFRIYPSDKQEVVQMAKFTAETKGAIKVAILYQDNDYGRGIAEGYTTELKKLGVLNASQVLLPKGEVDYTIPVSQALSTHPDAIYIGAYSDTIIAALNAIKGAGYKGAILTTSAINAPGAFARAGSLVDNIYFCVPPTDLDRGDNPIAVEFKRAYTERFGKTPGIFSAYGFDSFLVLATALKDGGTYPEDVYKGLKGLQRFKGVTGPITFNSRGDVSKFPRVFWYTKGHAVDFAEYKKKKREELKKKIDKLRHQKL